MQKELRELYDALKDYDERSINELNRLACRKLNKIETERAQQTFFKIMEEIDSKRNFCGINLDKNEWYLWNTAAYMFTAGLKI